MHALSAVPLAGLVAAQLSEALNEPVTLDLRRGRATDVATLARAVGSLVTAGVDVNEARELVGNMTRRERFTVAGRCTVCGRVRDRTDRLRCAACRASQCAREQQAT